MKFALALLIFYGSMFKPIDWLLRRCVIRAYDEHLFDELMERYRPDLVFLPTTFGNNDIRLLKYCLSNGVPNIGMIKSWDNLLGKDPMLLWPDRLIVHNELVKGYAHNMYGYPTERIYISGIPQFDAYVSPGTLLSKEEFFALHKLDTQKRLIVYSCMGSWISLHETETIEALQDVVASGTLGEPAQLLVRMHPVYGKEYERLRQIPGIVIVRPGISGPNATAGRFDFEFRINDTRELASTLKWADVLLNSGSTMTIDAVCFDTPIINIAFDGKDLQETQERSARRLLIKEHYLPIVESGGVRVAHSVAEMVQQIKAYFADRSLDHAGRMRMVREQCYKLDGQAGKRVGHVVLDLLQETTS